MALGSELTLVVSRGTVESASSDIASPASSGSFVMTSPGFVAFLARDSVGTVMDFIHVHVVKATALSIDEAKGFPSAKTIGATIEVGASLTAGTSPLLGNYHCQWSVSDATLAELEPRAFPLDEVDVKLLARGYVTVSATCIGLSASVTWHVTDLDAASDVDAEDAADE